MKKRNLMFLVLMIVIAVMALTFTACDEFEYLKYFKCNGNHTWNEGDIIEEPTCFAEGRVVFTCTVCGKKQTGSIDKLEHIVIVDNSADPTCTTNGLTEGSHCAICNTILVAQQVVTALGHDWEVNVTHNPNCVEDGNVHMHCANCGEDKDEKIDALGHTIIHHEAQAPTCTAIGWEAYDTCAKCDYTTYQEIDALGHKTSDWIVDVSATCEHAGSKHKECTECHEVLETETISIKEHTPSDWTVSAQETCTHDGEEIITCTECGALLDSRVIPMHAHKPVDDEAVAPTCTTSGLTAGSHCDECGKMLDAQLVVDALGHDWKVDSTTPATCTEDGNVHLVCSRDNCDATNDKPIAALGHDLAHHDAQAPTCEDAGWNEYDTCSRCDYTTYQGIKELGHSFDAGKVTTEPTCTTDGVKTYTCSNCGGTKTEKIDALGHALTHHDAQAPTCEEIGWDAYDTCSNCDYTTYVEKAALGHHYVVDSAVAPTCTEPGLTAGSHCDRKGCDHVLVEQKVVPATGHSYVDVTVAPTCTAYGYTTHTCSICSDTYTDSTVDALRHDIVVDEAVAPTCTETGLTEGSHCDRCKETLVAQETVKALGHDIVTDGAVAPTCTEPGLTEGHHCSRCDGATVAQEEIPATGHTAVTDAAVASTCTATGLTEGSHCDVCGDVLVAQEEVAMIAHTPGEWIVDKEPTCTEKGDQHKECSVCHTTLATDTIAALGHSYTTEEIIAKVPATCNSTGTKAHFYCSVCKKNFDANGNEIEDLTIAVDTLNHVYGKVQYKVKKIDGVLTGVAYKVCSNGDSTATVETTTNVISVTTATCEKDGVRTYTLTFTKAGVKTVKVAEDKLSEDGTHTYSNACDADCNVCGATRTPADHEWSTWTDNGDGTHTCTCSVCDKTETGNHTLYIGEDAPNGWIIDEETGAHYHLCGDCLAEYDKASHTVDEWLDVEDPEKHMGECSVCGATLVQKHSWTDNEERVAETGYVWQICVCGAQQKVLKCGHPTTDVKYDTDGHWTECSVCGTVTVSKVGHTFSETWTSDDTNHWHKCTGCDTISGSESHNFGETWTSDGTQHWHVCADCGAAGEKQGHNFGETWTSDDTQHWQVCADCGATSEKQNHTPVTDDAVLPSCTETGLTAGSHCSVCSKVLTKQEEVPAKSHNWNDETEKCIDCGTAAFSIRLLESTSDLHAGMQILIASSSQGVVAGDISSNVMGTVSATFSDDGSTITLLPDGAVVLTVGGEAGAWTLSYNGKLLGTTAAKAVTWDGGTTTWTISIDENGNATIQSTADGYGRFLHNVNSTRFTTYTSNPTVSMLLPQIYVMECKHHIGVAIADAVAPTCTKEGMTAGSKCKNCGEIIEAPAVVSANGHDMVPVAAAEATCTTPGHESGLQCSVCGYLDANITAPVTSHTPVENSYTDTDGDTHTFTCQYCENTITENHDFSGGDCDCGAKQIVYEEQTYATLTFPGDTTASIQNYTSTWTAKVGTRKWTISNFNNNRNGWKYIKCGNNKNESTATITLDNLVEYEVTEVKLKIDAITVAKVDSIKLYVFDSVGGQICIVSVEVSTISTDEPVVIVVPEDERGKNYRYQLQFVCKKGESNGLVTVSSVEYIALMPALA